MNITLQMAICKFLEAKRAQRLSENTLNDYQNTYRRFSAWLGSDPLVSRITQDHITRFMAATTDVSKKTALNYHTGLSSLWRWLVESGYTNQNIVRLVTPPDPEQREIIPFTRPEVKGLLNAVEAGRNPKRDRAIVLLLLDTGMRVSELCQVKIKHVSWLQRTIKVVGKGSKERQVKFSQRTMRSVQDYLRDRTGPRVKAAPLFLSEYGQEMNRHTVRQLIERLGERAGVADAHPHRFRHTFAINFLRNGGNIYTLQKLLGHTTLDMVKRYLAIAQIDIDRDHDRASPVTNWDL